MNIGAGSGYPSSALSNFAGHRFILDEVECYSMEGFLQGLKFKSPEMQEAVCKLIGKAAKFKGKKKKWYVDQTLYWRGKPIARKSEKYQQLLDDAYNAMFEQSDSFRRALMSTRGATLTHSMGKTDQSRTVLTTSEFCGRLTRLRDTGTCIKEKAKGFDAAKVLMHVANKEFMEDLHAETKAETEQMLAASGLEFSDRTVDILVDNMLDSTTVSYNSITNN